MHEDRRRISRGSHTARALLGIALAGVLAGAGTTVLSKTELPVYEIASGVSGTLTAVGSETLGAMMRPWQSAFVRLYPAATLEYEGMGSATAPIALLQGTAELGLMSREMLSSERARFASLYGYEPTSIRVARDALAVFVHRDNPVEALTFEELDALFSATRACGASNPIRRWGALGLSGSWASNPVTPYGRNAASGTYASFKREALCRGDFRRDVNELAGGEAVLEAVSRDPGGIGYGPIGLLDDRVRALALSRDGLRFAKPGAQTLDDGSYPLTRDLFVYINRRPGTPLDPLVREFLLFVLSREGQAIVARAGYQPLAAGEALRQRRALRRGYDEGGLP